jgi:rhodanese-related sulfurtransferase
LRNDLLPKAFFQPAALVLSAVLVSLGVNHLRPDGLALIRDWSAQARPATPSGQSMVIDLDRASALHRAGQAVFVDARPALLYAQGHIAGAFNVPRQRVNDHLLDFFEKVPDTETLIIAYCDGEACELSENLARMLQDMGHKNVKVLINGWSLWMRHGHSTAKGENHGA